MTERSYNGWPASKDKTAIGVVDFVVAGHSFPGGVKGGDVAVVLRWVVEQWHKRVESLGIPGPADEWGYSYRPNRNDPSTLSCHASGTAVDVNASHHPNGQRRTLSYAQIGVLHQILAEVDHVVKWGGDFTGTADEMHLEIHGDSAAVKRVADKIRAGMPFHYWRSLRLTTPYMRGDDVKHAQGRLHIAQDGVYGPGTARTVATFQRNRGLPVTGAIDRATAIQLG